MHEQPANTSEFVLVDDPAPAVRLVTLNRPSALNAFNRRLFDGVRTALEQAAADDEIRCVVLTGSGRAFTAGLDISEPSDQEEPDAYEPFISCVESFSKPLVAAVNGVAVGIGTTLLGHCDLVLAADSARFRVPFTSLGLVPEAGSTVTLPILLGRQHAAYALLTGAWISCEEAVRNGLVWKSVGGQDLIAKALSVAGRIAEQPLEALVTTKRLMLEERLPAALEARRREETAFRRLLDGPDYLNAAAAFQHRRPETQQVEP